MQKDMLESLGYKVIATNDSKYAISFFEDNYENIDAVITDMNMPKVSGTSLARMMLALNPDIRILLTTGYDSTSYRDSGLFYDFIDKPFQMAPFSRKIAGLFN
jgi:CheY-like chemotaxis protein